MLNRMMLSVVGAAVFAGFGTLLLGFWTPQAVAAPEVGSGAISLSAINYTQIVYEETTIDPLPMVGVSLKITAGSATVEKWTGSEWSSVGLLTANQGTTFEGDYSKIRVKANIASTVGTYSNRRPTNEDTLSAIVGEGTVSLSTSPIRVFTRADEHHRNLLIENTGTGTVSIRKTSSGTDLISIAAGDAAFLSDLTAEYWLSGSGTASYTVYDEYAAIGKTIKPGTCSGQNALKTIFTGDGSTCFKVTITNTGGANVTIKSKYKASSSPESDQTLAPEDSIDVTCKLEWIKIQFGSTSSSVSFTSTAQTTP